ncbi:MAG: nucleoside-diphosphate sugar epimerase [Pseudomonadota bacterium]
MAEAARVVLVAGATGLVGRAVLAALLAADPSAAKSTTPSNASAAPGNGALPPEVHALHALGRRTPDISHPRLHLHAVDFAVLGAKPVVPALPHVDDVYITLGTTIKAAGSQEAFRAVDLDAAIATARTALAAGATRCGVVTAMGADAHSRIFYNRVKGEVEQVLKSLGFATLVIARPSLLLGERQALGQAPRAAESFSIQAFKLLDPIIPANYRARPGSDVARALVRAVQAGQTAGAPRVQVLTGRALEA